MTLVDYFARFLKTYAKDPEFVVYVMKALEKLGHPVSWKLKQESVQGCRINPAKCNE